MVKKTNSVPFRKFMGFPSFIGFQTIILVTVAPFIPFTPEAMGKGLLVRAAFRAWAMHFLGGATINRALKTMAGLIGGIIASVILIESGGVFSGLNGSVAPWGTVWAVFFVAFLVISADRVPGINFLPSYFIGSVACFAVTGYVQRPDSVDHYTWYLLVASLLIAAITGLVLDGAQGFLRFGAILK